MCSGRKRVIPGVSRARADQPKVINGFSDLMIEVFGDKIGAHARSAVRMAELPLNIPVEIEMVLEVE